MKEYQGPAFGSTDDPFVPDNLLGGDFPLVTEDVTIAEGQDIVRGTVLGKITYSGEYVESIAAANDGSETPVAVAVADVDATAESVVSPVYLTGIFNENALTIGAGHTVETIKDALRALSIFIKKAVVAG